MARWALLIWGALSLAGVIVLGALFVRDFSVFGASPPAKVDAASAQDVRFVLNGCELGDQRIEQVVHSHVSARSFTGDYRDAYAIKISHLELAELTANTDDRLGRWYRGDDLPKILEAAVEFVGAGLHELPWFPPETELRSPEIYVYPCSIYTQGIEPSAVQLIFVRPSDKMVFYFGIKT